MIATTIANSDSLRLMLVSSCCATGFSTELAFHRQMRGPRSQRLTDMRPPSSKDTLGWRKETSARAPLEERRALGGHGTSEHDSGVDPEQVDRLAAAEDYGETGP